jgi:hypothetical protein
MHVRAHHSDQNFSRASLFTAFACTSSAGSAGPTAVVQRPEIYRLQRQVSVEEGCSCRNEELGKAYAGILQYLRDANRLAPGYRVTDMAFAYKNNPTTDNTPCRLSPMRGFNFGRFNQQARAAYRTPSMGSMVAAASVAQPTRQESLKPQDSFNAAVLPTPRVNDHLTRHESVHSQSSPDTAPQSHSVQGPLQVQGPDGLSMHRDSENDTAYSSSSAVHQPPLRTGSGGARGPSLLRNASAPPPVNGNSTMSRTLNNVTLDGTLNPRQNTSSVRGQAGWSAAQKMLDGKPRGTEKDPADMRIRGDDQDGVVRQLSGQSRARVAEDRAQAHFPSHPAARNGKGALYPQEGTINPQDNTINPRTATFNAPGISRTLNQSLTRGSNAIGNPVSVLEDLSGTINPKDSTLNARSGTLHGSYAPQRSFRALPSINRVPGPLEGTINPRTEMIPIPEQQPQHQPVAECGRRDSDRGSEGSGVVWESPAPGRPNIGHAAMPVKGVGMSSSQPPHFSHASMQSRSRSGREEFVDLNTLNPPPVSIDAPSATGHHAPAAPPRPMPAEQGSLGTPGINASFGGAGVGLTPGSRPGPSPGWVEIPDIKHMRVTPDEPLRVGDAGAAGAAAPGGFAPRPAPENGRNGDPRRIRVGPDNPLVMGGSASHAGQHPGGGAGSVQRPLDPSWSSRSHNSPSNYNDSFAQQQIMAPGPLGHYDNPAMQYGAAAQQYGARGGHYAAAPSGHAASPWSPRIVQGQPPVHKAMEMQAPPQYGHFNSFNEHNMGGVQGERNMYPSHHHHQPWRP